MPEPDHLSDASPPAPQQRYVFVYGTLRRGGINDLTRLQPVAHYVGTARVAGTLYHLGAYPGIMLGGEEWVHGEVYAIDPELEVQLDDIEDLGATPTDEYTKREVLVSVEGQLLPCLVYEINPRYVESALRIAHGDWMRREEDEPPVFRTTDD